MALFCSWRNMWGTLVIWQVTKVRLGLGSVETGDVELGSTTDLFAGPTLENGKHAMFLLFPYIVSSRFEKLGSLPARDTKVSIQFRLGNFVSFIPLAIAFAACPIRIFGRWSTLRTLSWKDFTVSRNTSI